MKSYNDLIFWLLSMISGSEIIATKGIIEATPATSITPPLGLISTLIANSNFGKPANKTRKSEIEVLCNGASPTVKFNLIQSHKLIFMNQKNVTQCSFCGSQSITELGYLSGLECLDCRAIFSSSLPSKKELKEHYARDIPRYESVTQGRLWTSPLQKYSEKYLRLVQSITEGGESLLDIGSSTTIFPRLAHEAGYRVTSADILKLDSTVRNLQNHLPRLERKNRIIRKL